ncbi:YafY family protein [Streptacidiphilus sp. P02-A3a]|uniref:helix-turn-helix transcriptional regulator n=1 Tax=Streptacidiphilus sp. P02-A3a TaxID=2704468 RepID=UPI0015FE57CE|nr:YafY family protein [Streptacidiphilus sp. P02-A3a]QMU69846.1 YafY family transcriptional regulator [Streptacidiphilus sp. P02-A3a]
MANTSSRTLRLLSLLQNHRHWPGGELADRLGVSARTLRRDIDRLRELGYPVEASRGVDGGYRLAAGAALPPLVVDDDEAVAIAVGMQAAALGAVAGIEEAAVRALAKLVQVMPPPLRRRMDALRAATEPPGWGAPAGAATDPAVLIAVALACRDTERVEFDYTDRGGEPSQRLVEPHRLVPLGRRWYLVAYDLVRQDWRIFRLDRLTAPRTSGVRFRPRDLPAADATAFVRAGVEARPTGYAVEVRVRAPAAEVAAQLGQWADAEPVDARTCVLRMTADTLDWPAMALGRLGAEFEVVTPPELVAYLSEWSARFGRATGRTSG